MKFRQEFSGEFARKLADHYLKDEDEWGDPVVADGCHVAAEVTLLRKEKSIEMEVSLAD